MDDVALWQGLPPELKMKVMLEVPPDEIDILKDGLCAAQPELCDPLFWYRWNIKWFGKRVRPLKRAREVALYRAAPFDVAAQPTLVRVLEHMTHYPTLSVQAFTSEPSGILDDFMERTDVQLVMEAGQRVVRVSDGQTRIEETTFEYLRRYSTFEELINEGFMGGLELSGATVPRWHFKVSSTDAPDTVVASGVVPYA